MSICQSNPNASIHPLHLAFNTPNGGKVAAFLLAKERDYTSHPREKGCRIWTKRYRDFDRIELIIRYASNPLTKKQLNKLLLKLTENQNADLIVELLAKYGAQISPKTKDSAIKIAQSLKATASFRSLVATTRRKCRGSLCYRLESMCKMKRIENEVKKQKISENVYAFANRNKLNQNHAAPNFKLDSKRLFDILIF